MSTNDFQTKRSQILAEQSENKRSVRLNILNELLQLESECGYEDKPKLYLTIARMNVEVMNFEMAEQYCNKALTIDPYHYAAVGWLKQIYEKTGQIEKMVKPTIDYVEKNIDKPIISVNYVGGEVVFEAAKYYYQGTTIKQDIPKAIALLQKILARGAEFMCHVEHEKCDCQSNYHKLIQTVKETIEFFES